MTTAALSYAAAKHLQLFNCPELRALIHGICPNCNEMLLAA
jgi:hypothetical protein